MSLIPSNLLVSEGTSFPNYAGRNDADFELTKLKGESK